MKIEKFKDKYQIFFILSLIIIFFCWYLIWKGGIFNLLLKEKQNTTTPLEIITNFTKNDQNNLNFKLFNEVYKIINNNYYSFNKISEKDLIYWMIKWLVESLWDKHSEFFNPEETKEFNQNLNWDFEWIWAVVQKNDFWVIVDRLIAGSPAKETWIFIGDIIIKANNIELKDLNLIDAVKQIKWPNWTKVKLEIIRPWETEILIKEVTRRKITIPSLESKKIDNIWYIILSIFWEKTWDEFKKTIDNLYSENISWLILDLRDNGWWYLETAVSILSNFIEKDKLLVITKEKNPLLNQSFFSYWNNNKKIPIVVILNWNSASASEITAWAIKDYKIWIILWEKSYGKWSVQQPYTLSDWSELKITTAKWYTPLDHSIDQEGIKPDIEVLLQKEDYEKKYDRQLEEAKNVLNKMIELKDISKTIEFFNNLKKEAENKKLNNITNSWSKK